MIVLIFLLQLLILSVILLVLLVYLKVLPIGNRAKKTDTISTMKSIATSNQPK